MHLKLKEGKNIPPGTPDPKQINVKRNLAIIKVNNTVTVKFCSLSAIIRSCPPPNNIG